jgi:hypothetical protein
MYDSLSFKFLDFKQLASGAVTLIGIIIQAQPIHNDVLAQRKINEQYLKTKDPGSAPHYWRTLKNSSR